MWATSKNNIFMAQKINRLFRYFMYAGGKGNGFLSIMKDTTLAGEIFKNQIFKDRT